MPLAPNPPRFNLLPLSSYSSVGPAYQTGDHNDSHQKVYLENCIFVFHFVCFVWNSTNWNIETDLAEPLGGKKYQSSLLITSKERFKLGAVKEYSAVIFSKNVTSSLHHNLCILEYSVWNILSSSLILILTFWPCHSQNWLTRNFLF